MGDRFRWSGRSYRPARLEIFQRRKRSCRGGVSGIRDRRRRNAVRDCGAPCRERSSVRRGHGLVVCCPSAYECAQGIRCLGSCGRHYCCNSLRDYRGKNFLGRTGVAGVLAPAPLRLPLSCPYVRRLDLETAACGLNGRRPSGCRTRLRPSGPGEKFSPASMPSVSAQLIADAPDGRASAVASQVRTSWRGKNLEATRKNGSRSRQPD